MTLVPYQTSISGSPCILVGSWGFVKCLSAESGAILWSLNLKNTGYNFVSISVYGHSIIVGCNGKLFVINADTGLVITEDGLGGWGIGEISIAHKGTNMDHQASNLVFNKSFREGNM